MGCCLWGLTESDTTSDLAAAIAGVLLFIFPSLGTCGFCYLSDSPIFAFWPLDIESTLDMMIAIITGAEGSRALYPKPRGR